MRPLLYLLFFILCLSSCQQRYWHVKKVKGDKTQNARHREIGKQPIDTGTHLVSEDAIVSSAPESASEAEESEDLSPSDIPEKEDKVIDKKDLPDYVPELKDYVKKINPKFFPYENGAEDPLSGRDILLILSIFLIVLTIVGLLLGLVAGVFMVWILFSLLFGTAVDILILSLIILGLMILVIIISYFIGRKLIRKKLQKEVSNFSLLIFYMLLLAGLAAINFMSAYVTQEIFGLVYLLLLILAIVYVFLY